MLNYGKNQNVLRVSSRAKAWAFLGSGNEGTNKLLKSFVFSYSSTGLKVNTENCGKSQGVEVVNCSFF